MPGVMSQGMFASPFGGQIGGINEGATPTWAQQQQSQQFPQYLANQKDIAQIGANAAMYPATLQNQRFNTAFGYMTGNLIPWAQGQFSNLAGGAGGTGAGGLSNISTGGVYNPQQIQQQVNTMRAQNDQGMNTQNRNLASKAGGAGFGSNSPLLAALQGQNFASTLGQNTAGETQIRQGAAQQNAQQQFAGQQARANQLLQARGQTLGTLNSLLGALGGMV